MTSSDMINHALMHVVPQFRLDLNHGMHGIGHWSRVWRNAREMCEVMDLPMNVPCLFSFFHDSQRFDKRSDIEHGHRAVQWLDRLYANRKLNIKASEFHLLCVAIEGHSHGKTVADPIVQVCWDADRLDLGRVGMRPDPRYLCTEHAKKPDTIRRAWNRSVNMRSSYGEDSCSDPACVCKPGTCR
jgi:uncharacterized protein